MLMPTSYSLRNRDSVNQVLISWRLEGSNDLVNWVMLDERHHDPQNVTALNLLCRKGATSTWGIDPLICQR